MKKIYYIIIGLIIVIGSIFMFIKTNNKNTNLTTIKVAEVTHSAFYTPFYIAIKNNYFKDNILFINVMCNLSVDCDCCAVAEDPCMKDIGILASTDPIAIDQACIDLIYNSKDPGRDHFVERVERQNGRHTIDAAAELGFGTKEYELINVD